MQCQAVELGRTISAIAQDGELPITGNPLLSQTVARWDTMTGCSICRAPALQHVHGSGATEHGVDARMGGGGGSGPFPSLAVSRRQGLCLRHVPWQNWERASEHRRRYAAVIGGYERGEFRPPL